jgi:hypothetical protein
MRSGDYPGQDSSKSQNNQPQYDLCGYRQAQHPPGRLLGLPGGQPITIDGGDSQQPQQQGQFHEHQPPIDGTNPSRRGATQCPSLARGPNQQGDNARHPQSSKAMR